MKPAAGQPADRSLATAAAAADKCSMSEKSTPSIDHPASGGQRWTDARTDGRAHGTEDASVDRKATYSRTMDVPEGALLTVEDLPIELVSFSVHPVNSVAQRNARLAAVFASTKA